MTEKKIKPRYTAEFRARGVRLYQEQRPENASDNAAYLAISSKPGCNSDTLRTWVQQIERDAGKRLGLTSDEQAKIKELEREVRELRQANEILRKASAYFA